MTVQLLTYLSKNSGVLSKNAFWSPMAALFTNPSMTGRDSSAFLVPSQSPRS